jgi:tight adherence protein C
MLGAAVFYIVYVTQQAAETSAAEGRLASDWGSDAVLPRLPAYIKWTRPLLQGGTLNLAAGFWNERQLETWRRRLVSAGLGRYIEPTHLVASKFWMGVISAAFMLLWVLFADEPPAPWFVIGLPLFAFFMPDIDLRSRTQTRQLEIRLAMPYMVDLLTLSIEAGLDFMGAIGKVVDRAPPSALVEELSVVLKDIQLGKTRAQSLRAFAERTDMPEVGSFVAVLVSADAMGASIGNVLRAQSESMRAERLTKAEKLGAQASQKILVPLVFFILPAVMLMIFGPLALSFFTGG